MEALREILLLLMQLSLGLLLLAIGLQTRWAEIIYVLSRPRLLVKSIIAVSIAVPVLAGIIVLTLRLPQVIELAIILMAVSGIAPVMPAKGLRLGGRRAYVIGLHVAIAISTIVVTPLAVFMLGKISETAAAISVGAVARVVMTGILLPLGIGFLVGHFFPGIALKAAPKLSIAANVVLAALFALILFRVGDTVIKLIGDGSVLAISAVVLGAAFGGHLLGGPDPHDRATLAIAAASRHPGIALLIAQTNVTDPRIGAAIILFFLVGLVVMVPYQHWQTRQMRDAEPRASGR